MTREAVFNVLERAAWTFVQAFAASLAVAMAGGASLNWRSALYAALIAGGAAVLSFVKTTAQEALGG